MLAASIKSENKSVDDVDENNKTLLEDTLWTEAVEKIRERQETRILDFWDPLSDDDGAMNVPYTLNMGVKCLVGSTFFSRLLF